MDKAFFKEEMHTYIDELYAHFEIYQEDVIRSLIEFDKVCRNNSISYYLGFGSLLGIVRDGEILPWDYDIDVIVPIYEKARLIEALKRELHPDYYFYSPEVDSKCRHYCMRITKKGYDSSAVHMDVFFLIGAPDSSNERERFRKEVKKVNLVRKAKLVDVKVESMGIDAFKYAMIAKKIVYKIIYPLPLLNKKQKRLCNQVSFEDAKYVTTMQAAADTYTKDVFMEPSEVLVNGVKICAPTNVVDFFNQTYKDYKGYPKISSRFEEFYSSSKRLAYFETMKSAESKKDYQINTY